MTWRLLLVFAIFQYVRNFCSGVVITECKNERAAVGEGTTVTLTCGKYDKDMEWRNEDDSRHVIGECDRVRCKTDHNLTFSLQAHETGSEKYESVLSITNISSEQTFHLKCRDKYTDEKAECLLQVIQPPQYDPTRCKVWLSNWRVLGECTVERMAASGVDYNCYWSENNKGKFGDFKDKPSYYTLHSVNYTRRVCSFDRNMNVAEEVYRYSMNIPGINDHFTKTLTVEHPGEATHTCPTMVSEGSSVTCRCNSSKAGNPPATTVWDGVKNETLHIENIQRQTKTNVYTCRVVWGSDGWINRSILHTFDVAYGPSSVRIDNIIDETGKEKDMLRLMCTAVDVHPSAIFRWNITCDTQTHNSNTSTCALSTANVSQGTVVTCTASNNFSSDISSYSSFVFDHTGGKSPGSENNSSVVFYTFLFLGLILIVIIVIVIAIVRRRKVLISKRRESSTSASLPEAENSSPERPTTSSHYVNIMARKEETEKGAKCNNDTLQSKRSTDYDEVCDRLAPNRCAAPSGDVYTRISKGSHPLNRETSDHNTPTIEAVIEGGASNFTQDEIDMYRQYYNKIKFVKSEPKRDTGVTGDLHRSADKDKNVEDAKFSQDVPLLIRLQSSESDSQSTFDSCVSPSRGIYGNVAETYNWQDNDNDSPHSLWLEAADVDMNVPMGTWVKSGERVSDSSSYLHPIPPDDDTYDRLML